MELVSSNMGIDIYNFDLSGDIDQMAALFDGYRVFYKQASDIDSAKEFIINNVSKRRSILLVASVGQELVGFTQLYPSLSSVQMAELFILNDLFVKPQLRGRGIGRHLLEAAQKLALAQKWKGMILETAKDNPAQYLYHSNGWKIDEDTLHFYWDAP